MPSQAIKILGVQVHPLTMDELNERISDLIERDVHAQVLNVNVHCLNLAHEQPWLRDVLNQAEIVFCDGAGVILGARLLGKHIPERITYADWFWHLGELAETRGYSLYFLGAKPGIAQKAAEKMTERFPQLRIVGVRDGYFDKDPGSAENEAVIHEINNLSPDILTVGMGMPLQERWLSDNWGRIDTRIGLSGGAVFDYISGELQRAPAWMTDHNMEWLGRLIIDPGRLWQRYLIGNPVFLARIIKERLLGRH